jgi:hypothetical protein
MTSIIRGSLVTLKVGYCTYLFYRKVREAIGSDKKLSTIEKVKLCFDGLYCVLEGANLGLSVVKPQILSSVFGSARNAHLICQSANAAAGIAECVNPILYHIETGRFNTMDKVRLLALVVLRADQSIHCPSTLHYKQSQQSEQILQMLGIGSTALTFGTTVIEVRQFFTQDFSGIHSLARLAADYARRGRTIVFNLFSRPPDSRPPDSRPIDTIDPVEEPLNLSILERLSQQFGSSSSSLGKRNHETMEQTQRIEQSRSDESDECSPREKRVCRDSERTPENNNND